MEIGNDYRYKCPLCKKNMYEQTYTSYWTSRKALYSDLAETEDHSVLSAHIIPNLAKCPHCSGLVFLNNLKKTEIERYSKEDLKDDVSKREYLKEPELKDLIKAEKEKIAKNEKEEMELRTNLWHEINDQYRKFAIYSADRNNAFELHKTEMKLWEKNCKALLKLFANELQKKKVDNDDESYINLYFNVAELHRNIGNFEECKKMVSALPKQFDWIKKQYIKKCKEEDRMVFEIKPKKEKIQEI